MEIPNQSGAHMNADLTPLHWAACHGDTESVRALLKAGADIEKRDNAGATPVIVAVTDEHSEVIEALVSNGANINAQDDRKVSVRRLLSGRSARCLGVSGRRVVTTWIRNLATRLAAKFFFRSKVIGRHRPIGRWQDQLPGSESQYEDFVVNRVPPASAARVYELLAVYPLIDPRAPVDRDSHLRQLFSHAKWENEEEAHRILTQLHQDGVDPAVLESLRALVPRPSAAGSSRLLENKQSVT